MLPPSRTDAFPTQLNVTEVPSEAMELIPHKIEDNAEREFDTPEAEAKRMDEKSGTPLIKGVKVTVPELAVFSSV